MKGIVFFLSVLIIGQIPPDFKSDQMKYSRVRTAFSEKLDTIKANLESHDIQLNKLNIYLRVFKSEEQLEVWGKNKSDTAFQLLKVYDICASSGKLGPKRQEGDLQVPEGFYHISVFNPASTFYLSLGVNYPNKSDRILGVQGSLGGDIYIHGSCCTIGCVPITDDKIKELYVYAVEARNNGQYRIPVTFFPMRLTLANMLKLSQDYADKTEYLNLWKDLEKAFRHFEKTKKLPEITVLSDGRHRVK